MSIIANDARPKASGAASREGSGFAHSSSLLDAPGFLSASVGTRTAGISRRYRPGVSGLLAGRQGLWHRFTRGPSDRSEGVAYIPQACAHKGGCPHRALGALFAFREWEEWVNLALGVWAILPWLIGFATVAGAAYAHVIIGLIVGVLAALDLWIIHNRPVSTI
jgi:hypothetical protein